MLELRAVHRTFHDGAQALHVLRGVDLVLEAGASIAIQGASGSGKSTLLQVAAGLDGPDRGTVRLQGEDLSAAGEGRLAALRRSQLGFVFQRYNLLPGLSAGDNLLFQRRLNGLRDADPWVAGLIGELGLGELLGRPVEVLSGGEQQRVAIARALAHRPGLVFADEPTGNLPEALGRRVMALFTRLVREAGSSLLLVTHNPVIAAHADRRCRLEDGRLVSCDPGPAGAP